MYKKNLENVIGKYLIKLKMVLFTNDIIICIVQFVWIT